VLPISTSRSAIPAIALISKDIAALAIVRFRRFFALEALFAAM